MKFINPILNHKRLHIIAFDVPYPPNYGGIADVFYKLKSLHEAGAEIIYHCFYYKGHNPPTKELEKYCKELHFYKRETGLMRLFSQIPYVTNTRRDHTLLTRLLTDPGVPIFMDGIQCCYWLKHPEIEKRAIIYRANNIEHEYYDGLAKWESNPLKKYYLKWEARKLFKYEGQLKKVNAILSVAKQDIPHFELYGKTYHVPPFFDDTHEQEFIESNQEQEKFVLFQGNLSVTENQHAAKHIIQEIAPLSDHKIVIAGKNPPASLKKMAERENNVTLFDTPSVEKMATLIRDAQIHLLMTFQQTGIKLKLLHALQSGKHIIINSKMDDSGIFSKMCAVEDGSKDIVSRIDELMDVHFSKTMKDERDNLFNSIFGNQKKAADILQLIDELTTVD